MQIQFSMNGLQRKVTHLTEDTGFHAVKAMGNLQSGRLRSVN